jgi:hypothetical protein
MKTLYEGTVFASFNLAHITPRGGSQTDLSWKGQKNGLCGTAAANEIKLNFGVHTGLVYLYIWQSETKPDLDASWEEVVEAPLLITANIDLYIYNLNGDTHGGPMPFTAGTYRARFSAKNFRLGDEQPTEHEPQKMMDLPAPNDMN